MEPENRKIRWLERVRRQLPTLERDERKALLEGAESGATGGVDFHVMMLLSSGLASLGLLEDSTAVVIGAMLVAPLMGPLIGAGFGLAQRNLLLYRSSIGVAFTGLLTGFAVSVAIGLLNPGFEPSLEVEARGSPDILDLGIAILSGIVAAYALGRSEVAGIPWPAWPSPPRWCHLCALSVSA